MKEIRVLFLTDKEYDIPFQDGIVIDYKIQLDIQYQIVLLDRNPNTDELVVLHKITQAHTLFITENVDLNLCRYYYECRLGKQINSNDIANFFKNEVKWFFPESYGEKYNSCNLAVSHNFKGKISWQGNYALKLDGDFGSNLTQIAFWRNNIPIETGQTIDFWLEYKKTPDVNICLKAVLFAAGSLSDIIGTWEFSEQDLDDIFRIKADKKGFLFVSLYASGNGSIDIIALHDRYSRGKYGHFIIGGERYLTSQREEIFCYFDAGDRKPPLSVYFSGYKTREGFEGYNMMRKMGVPFLLISEARFEGGGFYMGSEEYENLMNSVIKKYMNILNFTADDVILSGISMGSSGALYYGCDIRPHAIIAGKPLINLGTIALNEKRNRPQGFPTSLDILLINGGDTTQQAAEKLNTTFWNKIEKTDWNKTKLVLSYMLEDDYDMYAYDGILSCLSKKNAHIYGRGIHGRHNDNTTGIVQWFVSQYRKIIREDYSQYNNTFRKDI